MPANAVSLIPIRTRPLVPPRDDLWEALAPVLPALQEGDVLAITSKVVAIHRGRCVPIAEVGDREELVATEADAWIGRASSRYGITLAIKGSTLVASVGIDASNVFNDTAGQEGFLIPPEQDIFAPLLRCFAGPGHTD